MNENLFIFLPRPEILVRSDTCNKSIDETLAASSENELVFLLKRIQCCSLETNVSLNLSSYVIIIADKTCILLLQKI